MNISCSSSLSIMGQDASHEAVTVAFLLLIMTALQVAAINRNQKLWEQFCQTTTSNEAATVKK